MLSKRKSKYFKSLQLKKFRQTEGLFLVEGEKVVLEVIASNFTIHTLLCTDLFYEKYAKTIDEAEIEDCILVKSTDLIGIGTYKSNDTAIAIVYMPETTFQPAPTEGVTLVLEDINNPGNLGTILRIADWYGISQILCSHSSTDLYAPKVIQSSMGSFTRVNVYYVDLEEWLSQSKWPVFGAVLSGKSVYNTNLPENAILVMGSESHGISKELLAHIEHKIAIPRVGGAESLNVSVATAVLLDRFASANH